MEMLKTNKVEHFKSEKYEIKFSQFAFAPEFVAPQPVKEEDINELLYYSARES